MSARERLDRRSAGLGSAAPVRMVHLGLGNFFRAHQAWYTDRAPDGKAWGIAAFSGRSAVLADRLTAQNGLYSLITRAGDGDSAELVAAVSRAHPGPDTASLVGYLADPAVTVVSLTVTEAGYHRGPDGRLDRQATDVLADVAALQRGGSSPLRTMPARLVAGLLARRAAGDGPLAVVPCDNLPENGRVAATVVVDFAELVDPSLSAWIERKVSFVTTMVDRITPATTDDDITVAAALTGLSDCAPVVTEPFTEWVLCGEFPGGRPSWEAAGARFVADIVPFEQRKLWLLNGGHSLLAYAGGARGHTTVAEAVGDAACRAWLEQWWDEAARHLTLPAADVADYRSALVERFNNPRIRHLLAQIAADGSQKIPVRAVPVIRRERAAGRLPSGAIRMVAAWINHLRGAGVPVKDADDRVVGLAAGTLEAAVARIVGFLDPALVSDQPLTHAVTRACRSLAGDRPGA